MAKGKRKLGNSKIKSKQRFTDLKLATKLSVIIAIIVIVCLTTLIFSSLISAKKSLTNAINAEFEGIASENGLRVQSIFDDAQSVATDLQEFLLKTYKDSDGDNLAERFKNEKLKSYVYDAELSVLSYEAEKYILNSAWSLVKNNDDIEGLGVYFEPYKFDKDVDNYAFYINTKSAQMNSFEKYNSYSEFANTEHYKTAIKNKKLNFSEPYEYDGITIISATFPIIYNGDFKGVVVVDINVNNFKKIKTTDAKYKTMFASILDNDGTFIFDSGTAGIIGEDISTFNTQKDMEKMNEGFQDGQMFVVETMMTNEAGKTAKVNRFFYPINAAGETWWALTGLQTNDLEKDVTELTVIMTTIAVVATAIIVASIGLLIKRVLKPIDGIVEAAEKIKNGNLNLDLKVRNNDEIGFLAKTFNEMAVNLKAIIQDQNYVLGEMAQGNFMVDTTCSEKYIGEYKGILNAVRDINESLSDAMSQINQASDQVNSGAEQVSSAAQALSQGATEQAASIEELSATIGEIARQIADNADNAKMASEMSMEAGQGVMQSNDKMQDMLTAMHEISDTSNEINKIIKTIDDIAFQTNILALNAAVEAARAGSAGKGFAVVADEVRSLAGKSAEAAKNTTQLIGGIISAITNGTQIADETAKSLLEVVEKANTVNDNIQKISLASEEQADAVSQVEQGVEQISAVVQTNSATAEESAASSEELSGQSETLRDLVSRFKIKEN